MKKILLLLIIVAGSLAFNANAQTYTDFSHWSLALRGGISQFDGDIPQPTLLLPGGGINPTLGISIENTVTPLHGFGLEYLYLPYSGKDNAPAGYTLNGYSHQASLYWSLNLSNWLVKNRNSYKWNIYAQIGAGVAFYNANISNSGSTVWYDDYGNITTPALESVKDGWALVFPMGVNIEYNISRSIALGLRLEYDSYNKDNLDGAHLQNYKGVTNDYISVATLGIRYKINGNSDNHTRNIDIQEFEASLNKDIDKKVANMDSVLADKQKQIDAVDSKMKDLEPRIATLEKELSTDIDADGVPDYLDKCLNTPVADKGTVDVNGCGQSERSGMSAVPSVSPANANYAAYSNESSKTIKIKNVYFDLDKYNIKDGFIADLNNVVLYLNQNPSVNLVIKGHTDSSASEDYNLTLSENRAKEVKQYLVSKGISPDRLTTLGFGKTRPATDNDTPSGRALNRRVEFEIR